VFGCVKNVSITNFLSDIQLGQIAHSIIKEAMQHCLLLSNIFRILCVAIMSMLIHLLVAGVVLVQSLQVTSFIQFSVRQAAETENYLTSIERVQEYVNLVTEADPTTRPGIIEESWPSQGEIEFKEYVMSYRIDLPPVLNGISFKVDKNKTW
jgi:ABC-type multidrug transport system fused ATPase/permease subunit